MAEPPPAARPPDHPPVPRAPSGLSGLGFGSYLAIAITLAVVGGYGWIGVTQHQIAGPAKDEVPASVRASPGGYRSFHFWHSGYHGGK